MKSVALGHKDNTKIEPRNPHSQPQRKDGNGQQITQMEANNFLQNVQLSSSYSRLQHSRPDMSHGHDRVV